MADQYHFLSQRGSGKSSLIQAAFKVDMSVPVRIYYLILFSNPMYSTVCPENKAALGRAPDINFAFRPDDNHHLIVHEFSGLESGDDAQRLRAILDFILTRTDPNRPAPERLHAIW